jgi:hypothetical protein
LPCLWRATEGCSDPAVAAEIAAEVAAEVVAEVVAAVAVVAEGATEGVAAAESVVVAAGRAAALVVPAGSCQTRRRVSARRRAVQLLQSEGRSLLWIQCDCRR